MKKKTLALILISLFGCSKQQSSNLTYSLTKGSRWLGFGDSITFGGDSTDPATKGYFPIFCHDIGATFINYGYSGTTGQKAIPYIANSFVDRSQLIPTMGDKDYLLIAYGVNDLGQNGTYSASNWQFQLDSVINDLVNNRAWDTRHILIIAPWYLSQTSYNYDISKGSTTASLANHKTYISACKAVAVKWNTMYVDGYEIGLINGGDAVKDSVGGNYIHPNDVGHLAYANTLLKYFVF